jgi:hypothetical protein
MPHLSLRRRKSFGGAHFCAVGDVRENAPPVWRRLCTTERGFSDIDAPATAARVICAAASISVRAG